MNHTAKRIGSLFLSVCMVLTMLPSTVFAQTETKDSGVVPGANNHITAFAALDADIAAQTVEIGTTEEELNLPDKLIATTTDTTAQNTQTTLEVSNWTSDPAYTGETGNYTFTLTLDLPNGLSIDQGVKSPKIIVTVAEAPITVVAAPLTGTASGTISIADTQFTISDDTNQVTGHGWMWQKSTATLTLYSTYSGSPIFIDCNPNDTINLVYSGNVTVTSSTATPIRCEGNLTINGSGGTLRINYTGNTSDFVALESNNQLNIQSGNLYVTSAGTKTSSLIATAIYSRKDFTVSGTADLTVNVTGKHSNGILTDSWSEITFDTDGSITVNGSGTAYAVNAGILSGKINLLNGTVVLNQNDILQYCWGSLNHVGGTLNGKGPNESTQVATGTVQIGSEKKDLSVNQTGTGWVWFANTATLKLDSIYSSSNKIDIQCDPADNITLLLTDDVTLNITDAWGINVSGSLTILAGSHTLEVTSQYYDAIQAGGDITIKNGTVIATGGTNGITTGTSSGDIIITGSANVTATGFTDTTPIMSANGLQALSGNILIDTNGVVNTTGGKGAMMANGSITIQHGTVTANGGSFSMLGTTEGIRITDGTVTTNTTGIANGDIHGNLTVSGPAKVTVNGSILSGFSNLPGDLTVSNGTVTVTNTVEGATSATGGSVYVNGELISSTPQPVTRITLTPNTVTLYRNSTPKTITLSTTIAPDNTIDKTVTWHSSKPTVATVDANGKVTAVGNGKAVITATMTDGGYTATCTVTVKTNTSSSSSGNSSGSSLTPITTTIEKTPSQPTIASTPITATVDKNGAASTSIPEKSISDAIVKAQTDAKVQGKTTNATAVALNVTMPKGATSLAATLTRNSLNNLVSSGVNSLALNGSPVSISFDKKALSEIQKQSSGNITITLAPQATLSDSAKSMVGTRPVYDLTVKYTKDGKNAAVSNFNGGTATISIPYLPAKNETVGALYAVYVDEKGTATRISGSTYDSNSKSVIFITTHFSLYGIGYTAPAVTFTDTAAHWGKESIDYVVGRGLLSGTSNTTFAPDTAITRGALVAALGKLAGIDVTSYSTNSFSDVVLGSTLQPYMEWAYKTGIVQATNNGKFELNRAITHEELALIFANYAKVTGYTLPVAREAIIYTDASSIGSTYKTAVTAMQQSGVLMGSSGNQFHPKSDVSRAVASAMLHRYIKLTIDPSTAQGWTWNNAGQRLYYKDGKVLIGAQSIDGVKYVFQTDGTLKTGWIELDSKWYYFNTDGSLAINTKIDGYEIDENGVRKIK